MDEQLSPQLPHLSCVYHPGQTESQREHRTSLAIPTTTSILPALHISDLRRNFDTRHRPVISTTDVRYAQSRPPLSLRLTRKHRKFGKTIAKRQLDVPDYAASFVNYKGLKKLIKSLGANGAAVGAKNKATFFFRLVWSPGCMYGMWDGWTDACG